MKNALVFITIITQTCSFGQNSEANLLANQSAAKTVTIDLNDSNLQDWDPFFLVTKEQPKPASDYGLKKELLHQQRLAHKNTNTILNDGRSTIAPIPILLENFAANNAQGTPNDNHIAVSNDGKIVSVVNTNFRVYNDAGTQLQQRSLTSFTSAFGMLQNISDPRIIYDPLTDRFILIFFSGTTSSTTKIIVCFSKTNDPTAQWNVYSLNGNPLNDTTWSDYPIVTISDKDLYMTFNHLKDGFDWKSGFRYAAIWQIQKQEGYDGDSLKFNYWSNINFGGKPLWSICPLQGSLTSPTAANYFLSVRPGDLTNDSVFIHTISDSYSSGNAQLSTMLAKAPLTYGLPPNAAQKGGQYLATNDARVLCGIYENNKIQYVQNTVNPQNMMASVYVGEIDNPSSVSPALSAQIITNDTIDFGYPSIVYMGNNSFDNRAMITCSHSTTNTYPGTVAFYKDAQGNISDPLIIKTGESAVDILQDSVERWGDYTGIQRKFNKPNTAWISGSYTPTNQVWRTWVAKVANGDSSKVSSIKNTSPISRPTVYPNPTAERFSVQVSLPTNNYCKFELYDNNGRLVRLLQEDNFKAGDGIYSFNTNYLPNGTYFLKISNRGVLLQSEKISILR